MLNFNTLLEKLKHQLAAEKAQHPELPTVMPVRYDTDFFEKQGTILEQNKEPALSHAIGTFFTEGMGEVHIPNHDPNEDVITIAEKAAIVEEYSGQPLAEVLRSAKKKRAKLLIADALDDEPYISSQLAPTLQMSDQLVRGIRLAQKAVGAEEAHIEVYKEIYDTRIKIGKDLEGIPIDRIGGGYPVDQREERRRRAKNAVVIGACALIHLARAVDEGRIQTTCFVTVAGDCVTEPQNLEVTMDKTLEEILQHCGLLFEPSRIVIGGSMKGFAVTELAGVCVTSMTRGVLAFRESFKDMNYTCIGCGRCANVCPMGLTPYYIYKFVQSGRYNMLPNFDIDLCIGCGTCSYICPAKLNVSATIARGKQELHSYLAQQEERLHKRTLEQPTPAAAEIPEGIIAIKPMQEDSPAAVGCPDTEAGPSIAPVPEKGEKSSPSKRRQQKRGKAAHQEAAPEKERSADGAVESAVEAASAPLPAAEASPAADGTDTVGSAPEKPKRKRGKKKNKRSAEVSSADMAAAGPVQEDAAAVETTDRAAEPQGDRGLRTAMPQAEEAAKAQEQPCGDAQSTKQDTSPLPDVPMTADSADAAEQSARTTAEAPQPLQTEQEAVHRKADASDADSADAAAEAADAQEMLSDTPKGKWRSSKEIQGEEPSKTMPEKNKKKRRKAAKASAKSQLTQERGGVSDEASV